MTQRLVRWGILAPGRIAHRFAQALPSVSGASLQAVASRSSERSRAFAQEYGAVTAYDSNQAMAEDPQVDAVYIASPHRYHHEQARMCLEAGKAVLCEKPFTVNAAEAADLIELAGTKGLFLMEALWSRYLPVWLQIRDWLDQGSIGKLHLISSTFGIKPPRDPADRKFNHDLAGGALLDLGIYPISLSQWVTRRDPTAIQATAYLGDTGVDELTSVTMTYTPALVSQFTCGLMMKAANEMTIYGADGSIRVQADFWNPTRATLVAAGRETVIDGPFRVNGFEYQIEEAMGCIARGERESASMPLKETLANAAVMDEIRRQIGLRYSFE